MVELPRNNGFKFNLLPRLSAAELAIKRERDDSVLYATGIVLFAGIIWVVTLLVLNYLILPRVQQADGDITVVDSQISSFDDIRAKNGELIVKTQQLKPLLEKRVDTDVIFSVAEAIATNAGATGITSYRRDESGRFIFKIVAPDFEAVEQIMTNARNLPNVSNVELQSSTRSSLDNLVTNSVALNISGLN